MQLLGAKLHSVLLFNKLFLKIRKSLLALEFTTSKIRKRNLNRSFKNQIRKCGLKFKKLALILDRETNFFDSEVMKQMTAYI